jgi:hypothetical protein
MMQDPYLLFVQAIIKQQESIIGPLAWSEAKKVSGLNVTNDKIAISGNGKTVLESLVNQYETLFGQASVEVCKDAVKRFLPQVDKQAIPRILL